jgi:hypothetical protein
MNKIFKIDGVQNEQFEPATTDGSGGTTANFDEIEILATFETMSVQPNLTVADIIFRQDAVNTIYAHVDNGQIFEAQKFTIELQDGINNYLAFNGILNPLDKFVRWPDFCTMKIKDLYGLTQLENRASVVSFAYLADASYSGPGKITSVDYFDVPYEINYIPDALQEVVLGIQIYMVSEKLIDIPSKIKDISLDSGMSVWAVLISVAKLILFIIYMGILVILIAKMVDSYINNMFGQVRYYRTMKIKTMLERGAEYLGLTFQSSIFANGYENLVYLPLKSMKGNFGCNGKHGGLDDLLSPWQVRDDYGYPGAQSYGYTLLDIIHLVMQIFHAKPQAVNGVLFIESTVNKQFWEKTIQTMPNIGVETLSNEYNTNELKANYLIDYKLDSVDRNTYDNFTGTNYERLTNSTNTSLDATLSLITGLESVDIPCALGTRKHSLTGFENELLVFAKIVDGLMDVVGALSKKKYPKFANRITGRVGMLNLSTHSVGVPKLLICESDGTLSANYRDLMSAKTIYNTWHWTTSFCYNNGNENQYLLYKQVEIPFGFSDFLNCIQNSWFNTLDGRRGKFDSIKWRFGSDYAIVDYRIRMPYTIDNTGTNRLIETFIEG